MDGSGVGETTGVLEGVGVMVGVGVSVTKRGGLAVSEAAATSPLAGVLVGVAGGCGVALQAAAKSSTADRTPARRARRDWRWSMVG